MAQTTGPAFAVHAHSLATAFDVRLIESSQLKPEEGFALPTIRAVFVSAIVEELTYMIALHEIGHLVAPLGVVPIGAVQNDDARKRLQEDAAWAWARHHAIEWTPAMEHIAQWAEASYAADAPRVPPPPAMPRHSRPAPPVHRINWDDWK